MAPACHRQSGTPNPSLRVSPKRPPDGRSRFPVLLPRGSRSADAFAQDVSCSPRQAMTSLSMPSKTPLTREAIAVGGPVTKHALRPKLQNDRLDQMLGNQCVAADAPPQLQPSSRLFFVEAATV